MRDRGDAHFVSCVSVFGNAVCSNNCADAQLISGSRMGAGSALAYSMDGVVLEQGPNHGVTIITEGICNVWSSSVVSLANF